MKLRTSYCKPIALKKDIFRFAPLWALYLIGLVMFLPGIGSYGTYDRFARNFLMSAVPAFGVINIIYAAICAQLLFGDLFNTKLCYSLHAMPFRREGWLATHLLAGLLFSLVPNMVATAYLMLRMQAYWFLALCWLLAATLQFIFFFCIAAVSAMLTGNRFAMLAVYAIFNFFSLLLYAAVNVLYIPSLEGVVANFVSYSRFSPVVQIFTYDYFQFTRNIVNTADPLSSTVYHFDGLGNGWGYLAILASLGLAMMALSFWLYRKRHLESAGDFVAFSQLKAPACLILTLCVTLVFAMLGVAFDSLVVWLAVGLFIGFFGSLMLLERRLKVFRKKTFLHFGILAVAVGISVVAVEYDWLGIEKWLPQEDKVQSITVSDYDTESNYYYGFDGYATTVTEEADIAQLLLAHQDILNRLDEEVRYGHRVYFTYTMKSGRVVRRSYYAPASGENYRIVRHYLFTTPNLLGFTDAHAAAQNVSYIGTGMGRIPEEFYEKVLEALLQDAKEGYVLQDKGSAGDLMLEYNLDVENGSVYRYLSISADAPRLVPLLKGPEIAMGYSDWNAFLSSIQRLTIEDVGTEQKFYESDYEGLLSALRKDIEAGNIDPWAYVSNTPCICYEYRDSQGIYEYRQIYIPKEAEHVRAWLKEHQVS